MRQPGRETSSSTSPPGGVEVPRETQDAIRAVFGAREQFACRFVAHLVSTGVERGLIGPRETSRIWERHVLNCAAVAPLVPVGSDVVDVGSGAGLPGLALAIARPDLRVTLVEPLLRRVTWLTEVLADLGLREVSVVRGRAEELRGQVSGDVVTARAVAALPQLLSWCLPLVRSGGQVLAIKGEQAEDEVRRSQGALDALGVADVAVTRCEAPGLPDATVVTVISTR